MSDFGRLKAGRCPRYIPHQEISTQITPILKSHLGMMSRTQCHTPYLVSPICPLKIKTTTINEQSQPLSFQLILAYETYNPKSCFTCC